MKSLALHGNGIDKIRDILSAFAGFHSKPSGNAFERVKIGGTGSGGRENP
jgi:hypothetical protein